tara:strand:+ start:416 stop:1132 length:717 start_codon:yes stop_codon:yes gene_type:complete
MNENYTKDMLKTLVKVLKDNEIYRVNDVYGVSHKRPYVHICKEILTNDKYKDTILRNYLEKSNDKVCLLSLHSCILDYKEKNNIETARDDQLVIHVRSGDDYKNIGLGNEQVFNSLLEKVKETSSITSIVIVTALHYGNTNYPGVYKVTNKNNFKHLRYHAYNEDKSMMYPIRWAYNEESHNKNLDLLLDFIKKLPLPVTIQSSMNIDFDLVYLTFCKHLITSSGGFSNLINQLNKLE